jgi:hypothetical protein
MANRNPIATVRPETARGAWPGFPTHRRQMIVRIDKPDLLHELVEFLRLRIDCGVDQLSSDQLNIAIFGSYRDDAMRLELESRLRRWQMTHPGVQVEILDDAEGRLVQFPSLRDPVEIAPGLQMRPARSTREGGDSQSAPSPA